ncbi:hypothetical protein FG93_03776 [Bosea sp. LC85]|nr:hypothetical protein FG93_03776 [Bosea sp. LC85]
MIDVRATARAGFAVRYTHPLPLRERVGVRGRAARSGIRKDQAPNVLRVAQSLIRPLRGHLLPQGEKENRAPNSSHRCPMTKNPPSGSSGRRAPGRPGAARSDLARHWRPRRALAVLPQPRGRRHRSCIREDAFFYREAMRTLMTDRDRVVYKAVLALMSQGAVRAGQKAGATGDSREGAPVRREVMRRIPCHGRRAAGMSRAHHARACPEPPRIRL